MLSVQRSRICIVLTVEGVAIAGRGDGVKAGAVGDLLALGVNLGALQVRGWRRKEAMNGLGAQEIGQGSTAIHAAIQIHRESSNPPAVAHAVHSRARGADRASS